MANALEGKAVPFAPAVLVVRGLFGDKLYSRCHDCEDIICINKTLFGSMHICLTPEEIQAKRRRGR